MRLSSPCSSRRVFFFNTSISGTVYADRSGDGKRSRTEPGIAGRVVQLLDSNGALVATTTTDREGNYRFTNLELGTYQVHEVLPAGTRQMTATLRTVKLTRGAIVLNQDFGEIRIGIPIQGGWSGWDVSDWMRHEKRR